MTSRTLSRGAPVVGSVPRRVALLAAIAWAAGFALLSVAWAAGAGWGLGTIGGDVERLGRERDPGMVTLLWTTAALKFALAVPPLLLLRRPGHRWALRLTAAIAVLLVLYGAASLVQHALMLSGAIAVPDDLSDRELRWHIVLWDPVWLAGGAVFAVAGSATLRRRARRRAPA